MPLSTASSSSSGRRVGLGTSGVMKSTNGSNTFTGLKVKSFDVRDKAVFSTIGTSSGEQVIPIGPELGVPAPGACCTDVNTPGVNSSPVAEEVDANRRRRAGAVLLLYR